MPPPELLLRKLPEWGLLTSLLQNFSSLGEIEVLGTSECEKYEIPLLGLSLGSRDPEAPVLALFSGVHGLERIGTQVCLSLLRSLHQSLLWDDVLLQTLEKIRIVAVPLINPIGMLHQKRSNPNNVDLMRNAPIEAKARVPFLIGGQKISPRLPWYRGEKLEPENQALLNFCEKHFFQSKKVISLDFHSGFGVQDQIWFPYAGDNKPFPHLAEVHALKELFESTHPHHFYKIEPQSLNYMTHGDVWDHTYNLYQAQNPGVYLPLCLEMGSWMWVRKNPLQIFSPLGAFNPMQPHRHKRILRRHLTFFHFLIRALASSHSWSELGSEQKNKNFTRAQELWYED